VKRPLGRPTRRYQNIIKVNDREIDCDDVSGWIWLRIESHRGLSVGGIETLLFCLCTVSWLM
jgi:hypothetical protein